MEWLQIIAIVVVAVIIGTCVGVWTSRDLYKKNKKWSSSLKDWEMTLTEWSDELEQVRKGVIQRN